MPATMTPRLAPGKMYALLPCPGSYVCKHGDSIVKETLYTTIADILVWFSGNIFNYVTRGLMAAILDERHVANEPPFWTADTWYFGCNFKHLTRCTVTAIFKAYICDWVGFSLISSYPIQ